MSFYFNKTRCRGVVDDLENSLQLETSELNQVLRDREHECTGLRGYDPICREFSATVRQLRRNVDNMKYNLERFKELV